MDGNKPSLIFDLDGTLINIDNRWYDLHVQVTNKYRADALPRESYLQLKRDKTPEREIVKNLFVGDEVNKYLQDRNELIEDLSFLKKDTLKNGVTPMLTKLQEKYNLILLTRRKNEQNAIQIINDLKLGSYFVHIYISSAKTKTEIIRDIIDKQSMKVAFVIGDTEDDYYAAKETGLSVILTADGCRSKKFLSNLKPDYLFDTITDILTIL